MVLSAMVSVVTMKMATAEDEGLPIVFLDIDDVLCLNNPYGGSDALEVILPTNGGHLTWRFHRLER